MMTKVQENQINNYLFYNLIIFYSLMEPDSDNPLNWLRFFKDKSMITAYLILWSNRWILIKNFVTYRIYKTVLLLETKPILTDVWSTHNDVGFIFSKWYFITQFEIYWPLIKYWKLYYTNRVKIVQKNRTHIVELLPKLKEWFILLHFRFKHK